VPGSKEPSKVKFRYDGDDVRIYPSVSLEVSPGDVVDLDEALDFRFSPVVVEDLDAESTVDGDVDDAAF
jgi:hypothetical protein